MGNVGQALAAELEKESASTRRLLERIPTDRLGWQPHDKSMTLGQLGLHLAGLPGAFARLGRLDGLDAATVDFTPKAPQSTDEILAAWESSLADAKAFLSGLDDETANGSWRLSRGEQELAKMPRHELVRSLMFNHSYHHRGQLTVYLRLLDVPVPATYGNSADENPFAAQA
jgi:uncharacterized damage-inducible protein DinB